MSLVNIIGIIDIYYFHDEYPIQQSWIKASSKVQYVL